MQTETQKIIYVIYSFLVNGFHYLKGTWLLKNKVEKWIKGYKKMKYFLLFYTLLKNNQ